MKKFSLAVLMLSLLALPAILLTSAISKTPSFALSASSEEESLEEELDQAIDDQLGDLDFSELEDILNGSEGGSELFGGMSFFDKLVSIINGDFASDSSSVWEAILNLIFDGVLTFLPVIATIIAVSILGGMMQNLKPSFGKKSVGSIIHFVTYGVVIILTFSIVMRMITLTSNTLTSIKSQMDAVFPILLTMLTAVGGNVSVSVYQPAMALLSSFVINIFTMILLPLFLISTVLALVSNLSNNVKLDKLIGFMHSLFKWIVGIVFTVFIGFAAVQGITAGSIDGLSIKTAKFAIRSYIPLVGSYISDGFYILLASSSLIKNAIGAAGLLLLAGTLLSPILELVIFMLALKLMAGIIEPLGDGKIASFVSTLSKNMSLLISMLVAVSFMYMILTGLVMCSANIL